MIYNMYRETEAKLECLGVVNIGGFDNYLCENKIKEKAKLAFNITSEDCLLKGVSYKNDSIVEKVELVVDMEEIYTLKLMKEF